MIRAARLEAGAPEVTNGCCPEEKENKERNPYFPGWRPDGLKQDSLATGKTHKEHRGQRVPLRLPVLAPVSATWPTLLLMPSCRRPQPTGLFAPWLFLTCRSSWADQRLSSSACKQHRRKSRRRAEWSLGFCSFGGPFISISSKTYSTWMQEVTGAAPLTSISSLCTEPSL